MQPEFLIERTLCQNSDNICKSWAHPYWTNVISIYVKKELPVPQNPYFCEGCLETPPIQKKIPFVTPITLMKFIYG